MAAETEGSGYITVKDAARALGVKDSRVTQLLRSGELTAVKLAGRSWSIKPADIDDYWERQKQKGGVPRADIYPRSLASGSTETRGVTPSEEGESSVRIKALRLPEHEPYQMEVITTARHYVEWALKRATDEDLTPRKYREPFGDLSPEGLTFNKLLKRMPHLAPLDRNLTHALANRNRGEISDAAHKLAVILNDYTRYD